MTIATNILIEWFHSTGAKLALKALGVNMVSSTSPSIHIIKSLGVKRIGLQKVASSDQHPRVNCTSATAPSQRQAATLLCAN